MVFFLILFPFYVSPERMWRSAVVIWEKKCSLCPYLSKPCSSDVFVGFHLVDWSICLKSREDISSGTCSEKWRLWQCRRHLTNGNILFYEWFWVMTFGDTPRYLRYTYLYVKSTVSATSILHHVPGCQIASIW